MQEGWSSVGGQAPRAGITGCSSQGLPGLQEGSRQLLSGQLSHIQSRIGALSIAVSQALESTLKLLQNGLQPLWVAQMGQDLLEEGFLGLCKGPVAS